MRPLLRLVALGLLAACGGQGSTNVLPDAPDVVPPPPPVGPVSLRVLHDGQPGVGVAVVFQGNDSTVIATMMTDATGTATAEMSAGGYVTAIDPFGATDDVHDLRTFGSVKPGDELTLVEDSRTEPITINVTAPADAGATQYRLHTSCGSGAVVAAPAFQVTLEGCGGVADMLVMSLDDTGAPLQTLYQPSVTVTDAATVTLTAAYQALNDIDLTYYTGRSGDVIAGQTVLASQRGPMLETSFDVTIGAGTQTATLRLPTVPSGRMLTTSRLQMRPGTFGSHALLDWGPANVPHDIDLFQAFLPDFIDPPEFVQPRVIRWAEALPFPAALLESAPPPDVTRPDFVVAELAVSRPGTPTATSWRWTIAAPYFGPSVGFPELFGDASRYNVRPGDTTSVVALSTIKASGYDAVRARVLSSDRLEDLIVNPFSGRIASQSFRATP